MTMVDSLEKLHVALRGAEVCIRSFAASLGGVMQNVVDIWNTAGVMPVEKAQSRALERRIREAARAALHTGPVRLSCLRQRLRDLGAAHIDETSMRGIFVLTTEAKVMHLVLLPRLEASDRERWALHLVALALLDPHPPVEVVALDTVLRASGMVLVSTEDRP